METSAAQHNATSVDPTSIQQLKGRGDDPAARRAVAAQFGSFLTQGLMRNADGSALSMAEGVGADTVSSLFASVISQVASASPQLGLADVLLKAIPGATAGSGAAASAPASPATTLAPASSPTPSAVAPQQGFSLQAYRSGIRAFTSGGRPPPPSIAPPTATGVPMAGAGGASTSPATPAVGAVAAPTAATPNSSAAPVSGSSAGTPRQSSNAEARARFVQQVEPLLGDAARQLGVSPRVLLAQAALETGWGSAMPGNNLFGVKAGSDWSGATVSASTQESTPSGSSRQTDRFRAYPSIEAAVADYAKLVAGHSRYDAARGAGDDAQAYGAALARGGYATDPAYAAKLAATASSAAMSDARSGAPGSLYAAGPARGSRA